MQPLRAPPVLDDPTLPAPLDMPFRTLLAALPLVLAACAVAPETTTDARAPVRPAVGDRLAAAVDSIEADVARGAVPSAAFAVVQDGRIVYEGATGWADRARQRQATVRTPYPLASVTKPVVATAALALAEVGRLDLDAPALDALGWTSPDPADGYTVRQLLTHTSGLPTYAAIGWGEDAAPFGQRFAQYGIVAQPPGSVYEYSNLGYGMLGEVVAHAADQPLDDALADLVLRPLGMDDAALVVGATAPADGAARYGSDGAALPAVDNDTPGAGNLWASARDLARFAAFHLSDEPSPVLSSRGRAAMRDPGAAVPTSLYGGARYGLGWYVRSETGEPIVWHEGEMPGASALVALLPERDLAVVVLVNATGSNAQAQRYATWLLQAVAPDASALAFEATEGVPLYGGGDEWVGTWDGTVRVDGTDRPVSVTFSPDSTVTARLPDGAGGVAEAPALAAWVRGDLVLATLSGRVPGADVLPDAPATLLRLVRRGNRLDGFIAAYASSRGLEHLLPFRVRLRRAPTPAEPAPGGPD